MKEIDTKCRLRVYIRTVDDEKKIKMVLFNDFDCMRTNHPQAEQFFHAVIAATKINYTTYSRFQSRFTFLSA